MYLDDLTTLTRNFSGFTGDDIEYDGMRISRLRFRSEGTGLLPDIETSDLGAPRDGDIEENRDFPYYSFSPVERSRSGGTIILLHGLNEKSWDTYLPWAAQLCRNTGKTIILFPLAFHMDRAPSDWSSPRKMQALAVCRQARFKTDASSFVNAALSARLHAAPQRFFFSGLEAYSDILSLVRLIRRGGLPASGKHESIDFFGYSIGAFLTQILMLANPEDLLSESRGVLFCGGTTLDLMDPVSKYILDSVAARALRSCFSGRCLSTLPLMPGTAEAFDRFPEVSRVFVSMALSGEGREHREKLLRRVSGRLSAILLKNDRVMPAESVRKTLTGGRSILKNMVRVFDFPFPCDHVHPFSPAPGIAHRVDRAFREVFALASEALA